MAEFCYNMFMWNICESIPKSGILECLIEDDWDTSEHLCRTPTSLLHLSVWGR